MNEDYVAGFMAKAAELGVDPEGLVKTAIDPMLFAKMLSAAGVGTAALAATGAVPGALMGLAKGKGLLKTVGGAKVFKNKLRSAGGANIDDYNKLKGRLLDGPAIAVRDAARGARWRDPNSGKPMGSLGDQANVAMAAGNATAGAALMPSVVATLRRLAELGL